MQRGSTVVLTGLTDEAFFIECRRKLRAKNGSQALKIVSVDELRMERENDQGLWTTVLDTEDFAVSILDDGSFEDAMIRGVIGGVLDEHAIANIDQNGIFTTIDAYAQAFRLSAGARISRVEFALRDAGVGGASGNLYAKIYAAAGTFGSSAKPTGAALAVSEPVDVASLPGAYALIPFDFTTMAEVEADAVHCATLEFDGTPDGSDPTIGTDVFDASHGGNKSQRSRSTGLWEANATQDLIFRLSGFLVPWAPPSSRYRFVAECTLQDLVTGVETEDAFLAPARVVPSAENPIVAGVS